MKTFKYKNTSAVLAIDYDYEDDCTKASHYLVEPATGKTLAYIPWSPYSDPTDSEIDAWLALGAPSGVILKRPWGEQYVNFCSKVLEEITSGCKTVLGCEYIFNADHGVNT